MSVDPVYENFATTGAELYLPVVGLPDETVDETIGSGIQIDLDDGAGPVALDERLALVNRVALHVDSYGADRTGATNSRAAFVAAMAACAAQGGGVVSYAGGRYLIDGGDLDIPSDVYLRAQPHAGGRRTDVDYSTVKGAILLNASYSIQPGSNSGFSGNVFRQGLATPTNIRTALDELKNFSGTAIVLNGSDVSIDGAFILGFNLAIDTTGHERFYINDVRGDCINGLKVSQNYDTGRVSNIHFWPFFNTQTAWSVTTYSVSNVANNGSGGIRVTTSAAHALADDDVVTIKDVGGVTAANGRWSVTVINTTTFDLTGTVGVLGAASAAPSFAGSYTSGGTVYLRAGLRLGKAFSFDNLDVTYLHNAVAFGWDIGLDIGDGANAFTATNVSLDNLLAANDPASIGIRFTGNSYRSKITGGFISSFGRKIVCESTSVEENTVIGLLLGTGAGNTVDVQDGALTVIGGTIAGNVNVQNAANSALFVGVDMQGATYSFQSATARARTVRIGCRSESSVAAARVVGDRAVLARTDNSGALIDGVAIENDGIVNFGAGTQGGSLTVANLRNFTTPASAGTVGALGYLGLDDASAARTFSRLVGYAVNVGAATVSGAIGFETRGGGGALTERLRIRQNGQVRFIPMSTDPANPEDGDVYYNSATNKLRVYAGGSWVDLH
jgi:hypothetical protein